MTDWEKLNYIDPTLLNDGDCVIVRDHGQRLNLKYYAKTKDEIGCYIGIIDYHINYCLKKWFPKNFYVIFIGSEKDYLEFYKTEKSKKL